MEELERQLNEYLRVLDEKIERLSVLDSIMCRVVEISQFTIKASELTNLEEYYLEQLRKWMCSTERNLKELETKEVYNKEREKKYLSSLKRIKELEKENENVKNKYEYLKNKG
ncbi:hypothetical protein NEDG_01271 [Nematocida displodere]|uniref:Uncharacterized protein n=1 Tax=Nematocida displodere TaxID=1805483 RepID=A0A177EBK5_9MICR|nr:hypothetical protein NEDG_01271 [Nematocida displodere]